MISEKTKKLVKIANISEEEVSKLNYKQKQQHYAAKAKLGTRIHMSKDKDGNGITYRKNRI